MLAQAMLSDVLSGTTKTAIKFTDLMAVILLTAKRLIPKFP